MDGINSQAKLDRGSSRAYFLHRELQAAKDYQKEEKYSSLGKSTPIHYPVPNGQP